MTPETQLFDDQGRRLYLNTEEREAFLAAAAKQPIAAERLFAETVTFTGCRVSEALQIAPDRLDLSDNRVTFRSLKKRPKADGSPANIYRAIPVPPDYLERLDLAFSVRRKQRQQNACSVPLWSFSTRQRGYQIITDIMKQADIAPGPHRTPKGLRHSFGVHAVVRGVPLSTLQKWLGHAQLTTTAIYANAVGAEEAALAAQMWA